MLVEDDSNLGMLLQEYLNAKGFDAVIATDGVEGYKTYLNGEFDLCILDVMMPQKDGFAWQKTLEIRTKRFLLFF